MNIFDKNLIYFMSCVEPSMNFTRFVVVAAAFSHVFQFSVLIPRNDCILKYFLDKLAINSCPVLINNVCHFELFDFKNCTIINLNNIIFIQIYFFCKKAHHSIDNFDIIFFSLNLCFRWLHFYLIQLYYAR